MTDPQDVTPPGVLIVEDDSELAGLVAAHLQDSAFSVEVVGDAASALSRLERRSFDMVVLDLMLPGEDGLSLCRRIVRAHRVGVIMVTARGEESDRIVGLQLGADDYLPKPFSLWELEARIRAVLRRMSGARIQEPPGRRRSGPFELDLEARTVRLRGEAIELTRSEFDLLTRLTAEPGRVFTRDMLLTSIQGGQTDAFDRAVDTHIANLRRKIERDPRRPEHLKTVWGVGYRFEAQSCG